MPISSYLSNKWDQRLYNWILWASGNPARSAGVSSIYDPARWRRGSRRAAGLAILAGDAEETDDYLMAIMQDKEHGGDRVYAALVEWTRDNGTRGMQAARLSMHVDTYREIVDSGKRWLEDRQRIAQRKRDRKCRI